MIFLEQLLDYAETAGAMLLLYGEWVQEFFKESRTKNEGPNFIFIFVSFRPQTFSLWFVRICK